MKNKKIYFIGFLLGASLFFLTQFSSCAFTQEKDHAASVETVEDKNKDETSDCCSSKETGEYTDNSIYQLESDWIDQSGNKFTIGELQGKPVVFTMFFASCTYACPILINDMQKIESLISKEKLNDYKFVLVSIDPERDTPEKLKELSEKHDLDLNRWKLLTGSADDVMELAALIGFKYKKDSNGDFSHSNLITLLNENGEILHQHFGLNKDVKVAVNFLKDTKTKNL